MITSISVRFREICAIFFSASHHPAIHCNAFVILFSFLILELCILPVLAFVGGLLSGFPTDMYLDVRSKWVGEAD